MIKTWLCLGATALLSCILTLLFTPPVRALMCRIGAIDQPDARRVNRVPVPRGGGLAVILAVYVALGISWLTMPWLFEASMMGTLFPYYVVASVVLLIIGLCDDLRGLSPWTKLVAQIFVAGLLCYGGARFILPTAWGDWVSSPWIYTPLTLAWYIGIINAFNLIDGLDGLSSGLGIIATLGMVGVLILEDITIMPVFSLIFAGALLGFLRYNYNPASIFLGDTGSLFIGLSLATIALVTRRSDAFLVTMGIPILCMGVPLIDTFLAILRRTLRKLVHKNDGCATGGTMTADRDHIHHRFLTMAHGNQRIAVWGLYGLTLALVALGFCTVALRTSRVAVFLVGFLAITTVVVRFMLDIEFLDVGRLLTKPGARIGRRIIAVPLYLLADIVILAFTFAGLTYCFSDFLPDHPILTWIAISLVYSVPVLIGLVLIHSHVRIWGRSARKDFVLLPATVCVSCLISHLLFAFVVPQHAPLLCSFHILWTAIIPLPLLMVRLLKTAFLQWVAYSENSRNKKLSLSDPTINRILFYGAGINLESYIRLFEINVSRNRDALIGILDDNRSFRGRIFYNLKIFGALELLEDPVLFKKLHPTQIIVTTPAIEEKRLSEIRAFCQKHQIRLTRCILSEEQLLP